jgi:hypothetical protein
MFHFIYQIELASYAISQLKHFLVPCLSRSVSFPPPQPLTCVAVLGFGVPFARCIGFSFSFIASRLPADCCTICTADWKLGNSKLLCRYIRNVVTFHSIQSKDKQVMSPNRKLHMECPFSNCCSLKSRQTLSTFCTSLKFLSR